MSVTLTGQKKKEEIWLYFANCSIDCTDVTQFDFLFKVWIVKNMYSNNPKFGTDAVVALKTIHT